jgi:hypothetical protein
VTSVERDNIQMETMQREKLAQWCVEWKKGLSRIQGKRPNFKEETGTYYLDSLYDNTIFQIDDVEFRWTYPVCGLREKEIDQKTGLSMNIDLDKAYMRKVYGQVVTKEDYEAVSNHAYLMMFHGKPGPTRAAACDFSGFRKAQLLGFLLQLSQKKFVERKEEEEEVYYVKPVLTSVEKLRVLVVAEMEAEPKLDVTYFRKNDPETYFDTLSSRTYYRATCLGRLTDAVQIFQNLKETQLIIPGDGYGIFTAVGRLMGKEIVSGDSSVQMIKIAEKLEVEIRLETAEMTVDRGIEKFGPHALIFLSFLWAVASSIFAYCRRSGYRVLVYDKYTYYPGASEHIEYGSKLLRGPIDLEWRGLRMELSERQIEKGQKPLLTEIVKGPLSFDHIKGIKQIAIYSEMYPMKLKVSVYTEIPKKELQEMAIRHKFLIVKTCPLITIVRLWHNSRPNLSYDVDNWSIIPWTIDISKLIIGSVDQAALRILFGDRIKKVEPVSSKAKIGKKRVSLQPPFEEGTKFISGQNVVFVANRKYYLDRRVVLEPEEPNLYRDEYLRVVWLKRSRYKYELDKGINSYTAYNLIGH